MRAQIFYDEDVYTARHTAKYENQMRIASRIITRRAAAAYFRMPFREYMHESVEFAD